MAIKNELNPSSSKGKYDEQNPANNAINGELYYKKQVTSADIINAANTFYFFGEIDKFTDSNFRENNI